MENIIKEYFKNNSKNINIVGDKGYIKSKEYIEEIKNNNKVILITPLRINSKNKHTISDTDKLLLKERYKVEHFFSLLKRGYKRISIINDKLLNIYNNFLSIASTLIIIRQIIKLKA